MVFSGYNSKKPLSYLKSTPSNLSDCKGWCKIKFLKFGTKNVRFLYFCIGIWKYYCHVSNQRPRICLVAKFCSKIKILKFGTKNDFILVFLGWNLKKLLSCLISANSNLPDCKFRKTTMSKFETKNVWFEYFWVRILKTIVIFEISTFKLVKLQNFVKKQKCLNLGQKLPYLGIFGLEF